MNLTTVSGKPVIVRRARDLAPPAAKSGKSFSWTVSTLAGRLCELSTEPGSPWLTLISRLILDAASSGEPAAWVTASTDIFYPPDFDANRIDLGSLPVVFAPDARRASRAAEHLVRSGAFGLVILHIDGQRLSNAVLGRLGSLADQYNAAMLIVTSAAASRRENDTLGSLISLRLRCSVRRSSSLEERGTLCELTVTKDKRNGPGQVYTEVCNGIAGLC
jgi:recombination protein RecA